MRDNSISERIFDNLRRKGLTQKEFSEKTGISQSAISEWKKKGTNPNSDKIMLICNTLEISPYELLLGAGESKYGKPDFYMMDNGSEEARLVEIYQEIGDKDKARLLGYAEALRDMKKST